MKRNSDFKRRAKLRMQNSRNKKLTLKQRLIGCLVVFVIIFVAFVYPIWQFRLTFVGFLVPVVCGILIAAIVTVMILKRSITFWPLSIPAIILIGFLSVSLLFFVNSVFASSTTRELKLAITDRHYSHKSGSTVEVTYQNIDKSLSVSGNDTDLELSGYVILKVNRGALG